MVIMVTGASRGIGASLSETLTSSGHTVLLVSRNRKKLDQLADSCNKKAGRILAHSIPFDLTDLPELEQEFRSLVEAVSSCIDGLVNNAGQLIRKPFEKITTREARELFDANFFAPAALIRTCLPMMATSKLKHIVNVTSMAGFQGSSKFSGLSYYSASKAALSSLTECLAEELKGEGVKVNALAIGSVQTEMLSKAFPDLKAPMQSGDMARYMEWFLLEGAGFFNGKVLPVSLSTP